MAANRRVFDDNLWAHALRFFEEGYSLTGAAKKLGVARSTLSEEIERRKYPRPGRVVSPGGWWKPDVSGVQGLTIVQAAAQLGVSKDKLARALRRHKLSLNYSRARKLDLESVRGLSLAKAAKVLGVARSTLAKQAREKGLSWTRPPKYAPELIEGLMNSGITAAEAARRIGASPDWIRARWKTIRKQRSQVAA